MRLTKRIEALEKCRGDVSHHAIKMDFFKSLNRLINHYQFTIILQLQYVI